MRVKTGNAVKAIVSFKHNHLVMQIVRWFFSFLLFSFIGLAHAVENPTALEKVSLQLKWFHQFQFAGYYAAVEKGFFAEEGLDVDIRERILTKNFVKQVVDGESEYGVGDSGLISQYAKGEPIRALAAIFQHNPLVFMARQDSGIISPYEMVGKRIMSDIVSANEAPLRAMLAAVDITEKDYTVIPQSNDYDMLIRKEVDAISGYLTDQPFYFKQKGQAITIINPLNYGIDFYGDILFTSQKELEQHQDRADRFLRASLKGWRYALDHPEELIQIIHNKYHSQLPLDHLRFEAAETRKLIIPEVIEIGRIESARMRMVANAYESSGFNRALSDAELASFIYQGQRDDLKLTSEEKNWLLVHSKIRVGIDRDFAPYERMDEKGNYVGMAADYLRLIEKKLGVQFEIIGDRPWAEILAMAERGDLDMLACAVNTPERSQYLWFTEPYRSAHAVIIDDGQGGFIGSLSNLAGSRVAVEKDYFIQELIRKNHPQIQLVVADDTLSAMRLVLEEKADAYVGDAGSANYLIKKEGLLSLRFSGQTEYFSQHSFAINKHRPELFAIINKAMASIPDTEADAIFNRWSGLHVEQGIQAEIVYRYAAVAIVLVVLFGYWIYRLRAEVLVRKRAEEQLRISSLYSRSLIEASVDPLVTISPDGIIMDVNRATEQITGQPRNQLVGSNFSGYFTEPEMALAVYQQVFAQGVVTDYPLAIRHRTGQVTDVLYNASVYYDDQGNVQGVFAAARDITERQRLEQALRQDREKMTKLFLLCPLGIALTDMNGRYIEFNQAFCQICGYEEQELRQLDYWQLTPEKYKEQEQVQLQHLNETGQYGPYEKEYRRKNGILVPLRLNGMLMIGVDGQRYIWSIVEDITEQKRSETLLHQALDQAKQSAQIKAEFLANMSHEIRTPMNGIIGLSQLALNRPTAPEVRDYLEKIASSSQSLLGILNDVLDFSKLEVGRMIIENRPFELSLLLDNLRNLFEERAHVKQLVFKINIDEAIPGYLIGDALRIQQILSNLLGNAIKFTDKGEVSLSIRLKHRRANAVLLNFSVTDTGIGIDKVNIDRLFQPFTQADGSITRRFGGTGLGLAISRDLLELMGGQFFISSELLLGTTFSFDLKLGLVTEPNIFEDNRVPLPEVGGLERQLQKSAANLQGKRILVVEDNRINQQVVQGFLELSGIVVTLANNGCEALNCLEQNVFDGILMDIHMPLMGGLETTQRIRNMSDYQQLPIIALTAGVTQDERKTYLDVGMNDVIAKPINAEHLVATLAKWLQVTKADAYCNDQNQQKITASFAELTEGLSEFDFSNSLLMLGGNEALLLKLLAALVENIKEFSGSIRVSVAAGDYSKVAHWAHEMKGTAGNLGVKGLNQTLLQLESELKGNHCNEDTLLQLEQDIHFLVDFLTQASLWSEKLST